MDLSFLPNELTLALNRTNLNKLYEIRLRSGYPIKILYDNGLYYLSNKGVTTLKSQAIICTDTYISYIVQRVTENSVYAFNNEIKNGFITTKDGVRIGLAGECVIENDNIITIKNYSSINVRIPHLIDGCAKDLLSYVICGDKVFSTLIISPPFYGKTTMIKDIIKSVDKINLYNILVIDERGEVSYVGGENVDYIKYCSKSYAFTCGLRSLSPQIVFVDELASINDWKFVCDAIKSGVKVFASCHGESVKNVIDKLDIEKVDFDRYVVLTDYGYKRVSFKVYDGKGKLL